MGNTKSQSKRNSSITTNPVSPSSNAVDHSTKSVLSKKVLLMIQEGMIGGFKDDELNLNSK